MGDKRLAVSYSRMVDATLSLALSRFTSVFGMGTGGSNSLWPPGKAVSRAGAGHGRGGRCGARVGTRERGFAVERIGQGLEARGCRTVRVCVL